jgi:hypothetical protein
MSKQRAMTIFGSAGCQPAAFDSLPNALVFYPGVNINACAPQP